MALDRSKIDDVIEMVALWNTDDRISWNDYFMCLAYLTSSRSPCSRLHVGCVLVKNNRVISMGYNGFVTGEEHNSVIRWEPDGKQHEMATIHSEQNAVCYGANTGVSLNNAIAYVTHYPCINCAKILESSGIAQVYYHEDYNNDPLVPVVCSKLNIIKI